MSSSNKQKIYALSAAIAVFWLLVIIISLVRNINHNHNEVEQLVILEARSNFDKDLAFRLWGTSHGGVYVPIDDRTPPNSNLAHIPDRDITTASGKKLTLMNPAYMIRQIMDEYPGLYGTKGRITSLKPLWKGNTPDEWEQKALKSFEDGNEEAFEFTTQDAVSYLRLMRPMITKQGCLKCHEGYKVGDIRGGVGVKVPMAHFLKIEGSHNKQDYTTHTLVWLIGMIGIIIGTRRAIRNEQERAIADNKLKRSEAFLQKTIDGITESVMVIGTDYKVKLINNIAAQNISKQQDSGSHLYCYQVSHHRETPCNGNEHQCPLAHVLETGKPYTVVHIHKDSDDNERYIEIMASPLFNEDGSISGIIESGRDITQRKKAEEALKQSELWMSNIYNSLNEAVFVVSSDRILKNINKSAEIMFGYSKEEVLEHSMDIFHVDQEHFLEFSKTIKNAFDMGNMASCEFELKRKNGEVFPTEHTVTLLRDEADGTIGMVSIVRDITERKKAEEKTKAAHDRFIKILNGLDAAVYVADMDTYEVLFANKYLKENIGDVQGKLCWQSIQAGQTGPCNFCTNKFLLNENGRPKGAYRWEIQNTANDRWYSISDRAIEWVDGRIVRLEIATDITERKNMENDLRQALDDKDILIKEVHHRVKNNLAVIQSLLRLQLKDITDEKSKGYFVDTESRVKSMTMIHEMLHKSEDFTKLETSEYIRSFVNKLYYIYSTKNPDIRLQYDIDKISLDIDTMVPLGLIINELVSNSLKYAFPDRKKGELVVSLKEQEDAKYELIIKDTGIGLPKDFDINTITSLGLLIVNSLSHQIHGTLEIFNEGGAGFRIVFTERPVK